MFTRKYPKETITTTQVNMKSKPRIGRFPAERHALFDALLTQTQVNDQENQQGHRSSHGVHLVLFGEFSNGSENKTEVVRHRHGHERKQRWVRHGPHAFCALGQNEGRPQHVRQEQGARKRNRDLRRSAQTIGTGDPVDSLDHGLWIDELTHDVERTGGDDEEQRHDGDGVPDAEADLEVAHALVDLVLPHQKVVRRGVGQGPIGRTNFGASLEPFSTHIVHRTTVPTTKPIRTGIMIVHLPLAPSLRMRRLDIRIPNIRMPLNANSGAPFPTQRRLRWCRCSTGKSNLHRRSPTHAEANMKFKEYTMVTSVQNNSKPSAGADLIRENSIPMASTTLRFAITIYAEDAVNAVV